jgi:hypothetical protein
VLLLPGTTHVQVQTGVLAGRFVFDAVPALALLAALAAARTNGRLRLGAWLLAPAALLAFGTGGRGELAHYARDDRLVQAVQHELQRAAANAGPGRPFGVVGLPQLPLLQPGLWGFLTLRPFAPHDLDVVGLERMLTRDAGAASAFGDATPVHALVAEGAGFARWDGAAAAFVALPPAPASVVDFVADPAHPGRFVPPGPLSPLAVAALEITAPAPVAGWRAEVLGNLDGVFAAPPFVRGGEPPLATWWLDTTVVLPWLVAATFGGGPAGVDVWCDGVPAPPGTRVRAHARVAPLAAAEPAAAVDPVPRDALAARLLPPPAGDGELSCYLLLPTGVHVLTAGDGGHIALDDGTRAQLGFACDLLGPCRVHWFWQRRGGIGPPARSAMGTCVVR